MTHEQSPELCQRILNAALTGTAIELPECCLPDLIDLACEHLSDDVILGAEFIE